MNTQDSANIVHASQGGCCCANKPANSIKSQDASYSADSGLPRHHIQVEGASCGGCVRSIEQALQSVTGVIEARMDLANGIASVIGAVQPNDLIKALERVGFHSISIN